MDARICDLFTTPLQAGGFGTFRLRAHLVVNAAVVDAQRLPAMPIYSVCACLAKDDDAVKASKEIQFFLRELTRLQKCRAKMRAAAAQPFARLRLGHPECESSRSFVLQSKSAVDRDGISFFLKKNLKR